MKHFKKLFVFPVIIVLITGMFSGCGKNTEKNADLKENGFGKPTHTAEYYEKSYTPPTEDRIGYNGIIKIGEKEISIFTSYNALNEKYHDFSNDAETIVGANQSVSFSNNSILIEPLDGIVFENKEETDKKLGDMNIGYASYSVTSATLPKKVFGQQLLEWSDKLDFMDNIWKNFGMPDSFIRNNDSIDIVYNYYSYADAENPSLMYSILISFNFKDNSGTVKISSEK